MRPLERVLDVLEIVRAQMLRASIGRSVLPTTTATPRTCTSERPRTVAFYCDASRAATRPGYSPPSKSEASADTTSLPAMATAERGRGMTSPRKRLQPCNPTPHLA